MASLHRREGSPFWYSAYTLPSGVRTFRSTKQTDKKKAESIARDWEDKNRMAKEGRLSTAQARKGYNAILKDIGRKPLRDVRIGEYLLEWCEQQKEISGKKSTYERYKGIIKEFVISIGDTALMPLEALEPDDIEKFKGQQVAEGKSAGTINLLIKILRIPLNQARRQGLILTNPAEAITPIQKVANERMIFTDEQVEALLKVADVEWKGMILLGARAGMRLGDAANLIWKNIDLKGKLIRYTPIKTANQKKELPPVPMSDELVAYFSSIPVGISPSLPVFPKFFGHRVNSEHGLSRRFIALMEKVNIDRQKKTKKPKGKGRNFFALSFHSLRHTFISNMANSGVDKEMRKSIVGHSSDEHDRYTHIALEAKKEALAKMTKLKVE